MDELANDWVDDDCVKADAVGELVSASVDVNPVEV